MYEYLFNSFIIPNYKKNACSQPDSGTGAREYPPTTLPPQKINISDSCCGERFIPRSNRPEEFRMGKITLQFLWFRTKMIT